MWAVQTNLAWRKKTEMSDNPPAFTSFKRKTGQTTRSFTGSDVAKTSKIDKYQLDSFSNIVTRSRDRCAANAD